MVLLLDEVAERNIEAMVAKLEGRELLQLVVGQGRLLEQALQQLASKVVGRGNLSFHNLDFLALSFPRSPPGHPTTETMPTS
jgi:hypothetical protein